MIMESINIKDITILKNSRTELTKADLSELMSSIRENGLMHPIGVWVENGEYVLAYGHRRYAALKKLGRSELIIGDEIKVIDKPLTKEGFLIMNLSENIHRVDNSPIELAKGISELQECGLNLREIAVRLSIPRHRIETALRLLQKVPKKHVNEIGYNPRNTGKISATVADKITSIRGKQSDINELFKLAKRDQVTINEIDFYSKLLGNGYSLKEASKIKTTVKVQNPTLVVKLDKFSGTPKQLSLMIKEVFEGKRKPIQDLFY
jgi:ParB/RepB/Spo0J family partition protein